MNSKAPNCSKSLMMCEPQASALQITRSEGSCVFDGQGNRIIDFVMGWTVGNLGWGRAEIKRAMMEDHPSYVAPYYSYQRWSELAELLADLTPPTLRRSFRATGGTEAVEIALQTAMLCTRRTKFVSIEGSFHGNSIGTISVASSAYRKKYKGLLPDCHKIEPPLDSAAADRLEDALKRRDVAAFIMEPIICNLGVARIHEESQRAVHRIRYHTNL